MSSVITRFAPSPTGFLHIGGARTALFNYLYSKHMGGKFLLRVEDTDKSREVNASIDSITNGLKWLGINWDDEPVFQSKNSDKHKQIAIKLVEAGKAYYCYCSFSDNGGHAGDIKPCKCWSFKQDKPSKHNENRCIKLRVDIGNSEREIIINDLLLGQVASKASEISDFIILRSNQTAVYLLASVVDDINMGITHVIRGGDHLSNTFRHIELYRALELTPPSYAHIPLIYAEDGTKMSKRSGAIAVERYKELGYVKEAVCNYLMRLGWSHGNDEIISMQEAEKWFDITDVSKSPARFDFKKLNSINATYLNKMSNDQILKLLEQHLTTSNFLSKGKVFKSYKENLLKLIPFLKKRAKTLQEYIESAKFIMFEEVVFDQSVIEQTNLYKSHLVEQLNLLKDVNPFTREALHQLIKDYSIKNNLKLGDAVYALRVALTGEAVSPASVFDIMFILGQKITCDRINKLLIALE